MKFTTPVSILLAFPFLALADVEFTSPAPGSTVHGGDVLTAVWKESGEPPKLLELTDYDLFLCAGGASIEYSEELSLLIENGSFERGNSVSFQVKPETGAVYTNAYFLKMVSRGLNATVINYSQRFSLSDMTGTFSERVQHGLRLLPNATTEHGELKKRQVAAAATAAALYTVPYPAQSVGLTKYAPMAKHPGTTITAKSAPPQFPTSAYTIARTFLPIPTWQTTLTAPQTYSTTNIENPATPAPHPSDDMKKYLKRWTDSA
ncbi:putative beta-1,6-glucan boisynthesis protein [Talaromyces proteolyticus]|uniref:Beta-1,6-glucan boisynthesis protein n=1 Tax=Talaromyces proteolyticus TaxID=1131652 RepID=A0AAD4PZ04_9EURO|nr:putative beta-1,6-glucan boisynthesis protein [Talaromyces proteolyticus]KAH8695917.1 putative beta-1,6-glucan boisynthesis protein [Talaromyces proteolyticus]